MHYVFLLHGVGISNPGWSIPVSTALAEKANLYAAASGQALAEVKFIELRYDQILERNMQQFIDNGSTTGAVGAWLKQGWDNRGAGKIPDVNTFIRDYALDIGCYLFVRDTTIEVLDTLAQKMLEVMAGSPLKNDYSLICHSLGTKVGFDLLHLLYAKTTAAGNPKAANLDKLSPLFGLRDNGDVVRTSPDFSGLYLLANVMPLLNHFDQQAYDANSSHVRMSIPGTQGGVIRNNYRIINNHFDPIARAGGSGTIKKDVYSCNITYPQADAWLMHYLTQYTDHPAVHLPIIEDLYKIKIAEPLKKKAIAGFEAKFRNPAIESALETALKLLPDGSTVTSQNNILEFLFSYANKWSSSLPQSLSTPR